MKEKEKENSFQLLSDKELFDIEGGGLLELAAAYVIAAVGICYTLGKDGKSANSFKEAVEVDAISYAG
jgi:hypothetical protein